MGDRCYLHVTMTDADIERFGTFVGSGAGSCWWNDDLDEPTEGVKTVGVLEANWGWLEPLRQAAKDGLTFVGGHDAGCSYGAHAFVGVDGSYHEVPVTDGGLFAVGLDSGLKIDPERIAEICRFIRYRARARDILGLDRKADPGSIPESARCLAEAARQFSKESGRHDGMVGLDIGPRGVPAVEKIKEVDIAAGGS